LVEARLPELFTPGLASSLYSSLACKMLNWLKPMMWTPADTNWMRNLRGIVSGQRKT